MSDNFAASLSKAVRRRSMSPMKGKGIGAATSTAPTTAARAVVVPGNKTTSSSLRSSSNISVSSSSSSKKKKKQKNDGKHSSAVYIFDEAYSWLPARIVSTGGSAGSGDSNKVELAITLPKNWHHTTVLSPDSTILDLEELTVDTLTRTVSLSDYPRGELPLQNLDARGQLLGKRDMADLPFLHEAAILYNLKERHYNSQPYTRVGDIVVAMNPCRWITNLYSESTRNVYAASLIWKKQQDDEEEEEGGGDGEESAKTTPSNKSEKKKKKKDEDDSVLNTFGNMYDKLGYDPHVYETSCLAYRGLAVDQRNQTILVTGESGAGKTETVKIVMSHLATLEQTRPNDVDDGNDDESNNNKNNNDGKDSGSIVTRVLESNPVFEAFGNAKTLRNDNSSRFGKFTQLQFRVESTKAAKRNGRSIPLCNLAGSVCNTYLLEKSRVVSHSAGERTYHIFYQLLSAPAVLKRKLWKHLDGTTVDSFKYVGATIMDGGEEYKPPESDAELWPRTLDALEVFRFEGEKLQTLLRALCVVLQLGNLTFAEDPSSDVTEEGGTVISSREELSKLQDIIGIDGDTLERSMTTRVLKTGYDEVTVRLRPSVAKEACDALAKEIYARIFDVIVRSINDYTRGGQEQQQGGPDDFGVISLLDIFGFERFKVNRFEQLCINYANEQLQYKYVLDNFKQVQEEYESEGIEIFDFTMVDNSDILNLLEGRLGVIISLNEECVRPKGNDESFVYKIKIVHKEHDRMIDEKLHRKTEFGIRHFAGSVKYDATKFVERNTDKLPEDLLVCATQSTNDLIQTEFKALLQQASDPNGGNNNRKESTPVRRKKATNRTVLEKFRRQLRGLMENMEGTMTRYIRCIKPNDQMTPRLTDQSTTMRQLECAGLVTAITISRETFPNKLGYEITRNRFDCLMTKHDREYMVGVPPKDAVNYMLSNLLFSMVEEHANGSLTLPFACGNTKVYFRTGALEQLETKRLDYFTRSAVVIQKWIRRLQGESHYVSMRVAAVQLQRIGRGSIAYQRYQKQQNAAIFIESWVRGRQATKRVHSIRHNRAATIVQTKFRSKSKATQMLRFKKAAVVLQRAFRTKEKRENFSAKLAVAVEEARMDSKLLGLKEQVSQTAHRSPRKSSGRAVNEDLLEEIESMFDYLRKEIFTLRGKNADLKAELRDAENDKRELISHAESAEAAASSSRLQVAQLSKTLQAQTAEVSECKSEITSLRKQVKAKEQSREEDVESVKVDYEKVVKERDGEILSLQKTIKHARVAFEQEKKVVKEKIQKMEDAHVTEILRLKDELRRTQDSHHDYLAKLMDVLETTHAARESETARISAELNAVKEEKDAQIIALRREVDTLRKMNKVDVKTLQGEMKSKVTEVTVMRRELEDSSVGRNQRSRRFDEITRRLNVAVSPDNLVAITSARRGRGKKLSVVEEEALKMKRMIRILGELYEVEHSTQVKIDDETLRMLDSFMSAAEPNRMTKQLQAIIADLEAQNKKLREEAKTSGGACIRCAARDKRRMAKQRSHQDAERRRKAQEAMVVGEESPQGGDVEFPPNWGN